MRDILCIFLIVNYLSKEVRDLLFWIFLLLSESWLLKITKIIFVLFNVLLILSLSLFCYALFCAHSSFAFILRGKRELVALLSLSSWCLVIVVWLFIAVPWVGLQCMIGVLPDHTRLRFIACLKVMSVYFIVYFSKIKLDVLLLSWTGSCD